MPANYDLPENGVVKRVRYFDGLFLKDQDFIDDQKYHTDRQRRPNLLLRVAGICDGLTVLVENNQVKVTSGSALDNHGRLIVLSETVSIDLKGQTGDVDIYISYQEEASDITQANNDKSPAGAPAAAKGAKGATRWWENPRIEAVLKTAKPTAEDTIWLGRITVSGTTVQGNPNLDFRQYSGVYLPSSASSKNGPTLRSGGNVNPTLAILTGDLSVTGNVGIGTATVSNPQGWNRVLEIFGTGNARLNVRSSGEVITSVFSHDDWNGARGVIGTVSNHALTFVTNYTHQMTIDGVGKVGIGTPNPAEKLEIQMTGGDGQQTNFLSIFNNGGGQSQESRIVWKNGPDRKLAAAIASRPGGGYNTGDLRFQTATNGTLQEQMIIQSNGNIGIGTTSPAAKLSINGGLHVGGDSDPGDNNLLVDGNSTISGTLDFGSTTRQMITLWGSSNYGIGVQNSTQYFRTDKNFAWYKGGSHINDELGAGTSGTVQMVIKDGNVGIGTMTPAAKLNVNGTLSVTGNSTLSGTLSVTSNSTLSGNLSVTGNSTLSGNLSVTGNSTLSGSLTVATNKSVRLELGSNQKLSLGGNGTFEIDAPNVVGGRFKVSNEGKVGIGTTSPAELLQIADFSTNSDNYLKISTAGGNKYRAGIKFRVFNDELGFTIENDERAGRNGLNILRHSDDAKGTTALFIDKGNGQVVIPGALFVQGGLNYFWGPDGRWKNIQNRGGDMAGSYSTSGPSDIRFKTDLHPIHNALEKVMQLYGACYRWGETGLKHLTRDIEASVSAGPNATQEDNEKLWDGERQKAYQALSGEKIGLIAQNVETVVPEVVHEDEEGYKYVDYQHLTALLVEAIKDQHKLTTKLQEEMHSLKQILQT